MKSHKCPVCDGCGKVSKPPELAGVAYEDPYSWYGPWTCQACHGHGIIWEKVKRLYEEKGK